MRLGISGWVWTAPVKTADLEKLAPRVKQLGFDMLELPLETIGDVDYERVAAMLRDCGLGVSTYAVMTPARDLLYTEGAAHESAKQYIKQAIDATRLMGGTNLVGPLYGAVGQFRQQTPVERARDVDLLIATLRELAVYAGEHGVVLCIEPLNRFENSLVNLAEQALGIVERVGHSGCAVALNTFHMNIEEKALGSAIRKTGKQLRHFHAAENDRGAPGSGHVTWVAVAQALKEIKYDGPVVIESFSPKLKSMPRSMAMWREIEASPDALAESGGKFLKQLLG